jgi:hypothetical protein
VVAVSLEESLLECEFFCISISGMEKSIRTLRGGREPEEETYFAYSATLRVFGDIADMAEISGTLELRPTHSHRKGGRRGARSPVYRHDMWSYSPPVDKREPLRHHIDALWLKLKPHKGYLLGLKKSLSIDVFLGYQSNCAAGIVVPYASLEMFSQLEVPNLNHRHLGFVQRTSRSELPRLNVKVPYCSRNLSFISRCRRGL